MRRAIMAALALFLVLPGLALAQDTQQKMESALSAGPASITSQATVMDWDNTVLRQGTNGWTCFPDVPDTEGTDPMCLDAPWMNWAHAWLTKTSPTFSRMGFGYMLAGSGPGSNTDPYATGPTKDNQWISESVAHIMLIVPDPKALEGLPTDPKNGGPWVMWKGTPYVHVMIPTTGGGM